MWIVIIIIAVLVLLGLLSNAKPKKNPEDFYTRAIYEPIEKSSNTEKKPKKEPKQIKKEGAKKNSDFTVEDLIRFQTNKVDSQYLKPQLNLEDKSHYFYGKKVVITGTFDSFPFRNELAHLLWSVGADIDTQITQKIDIVIMGEDAGWKKLELIEEYQPEVIDQQILLDYFPYYNPKFNN